VSKDDRPSILLDEKKYYIEDMDDTEMNLVEHIKALGFKIEQDTFARQAYINALKMVFDKKDEEE
jgi:hypothetical protein|tara:strand:- start:524 stop:718 length:195 start_codon:yes stop_codon:yes gene_type:complete